MEKVQTLIYQKQWPKIHQSIEYLTKKIGIKKLRNITIDILIKYWRTGKRNLVRITDNLRKKILN